MSGIHIQVRIYSERTVIVIMIIMKTTPRQTLLFYFTFTAIISPFPSSFLPLLYSLTHFPPFFPPPFLYFSIHYHRDIPGASSIKHCYDCPAKYYCPIGSINYIACPAKYYCPVKSMNATICTAGGYCPPDSSVPLVCPVNYYCTIGTAVPLPCYRGKERRNNV